jgi:hypothetical protein
MAGENEAGSYESATTTWTNMTDQNQTLIFEFNYSDTNDNAYIHYNITVPPGETSGTKSSTVIVSAE